MLYLGHVRELHLTEILVAVGVAPHSGGCWDRSPGVRVDAPALAPLAMQRHFALKQKYTCKSGAYAKATHQECILWIDLLSASQPLFLNAWSHLFEVILPPLVAVGDVQSVQVFQRTSVISEGHLGYSLQYLVELLLTLTLKSSKHNKQSVMSPTHKMCTLAKYFHISQLLLKCKAILLYTLSCMNYSQWADGKSASVYSSLNMHRPFGTWKAAAPGGGSTVLLPR